MSDRDPPGRGETSVGVPGYVLGETLALSSRYHLRRAVRLSDGLPVVIKSLAAEYPSAREVRQLEFEYRMLNKLRAPGVIGVLDRVKVGEREAIVLEAAGGSDLSSLLSGEIPLDLFFTIAVKLASALGYVQAQNVIHKDIKPRNILFDPRSGALKLIDFSISSELSLCHQGVVSVSQLEGTFPYMSPEQTGRMNRDLDYRTDYYSMGVTLFELLTGSLPFTAMIVNAAHAIGDRVGGTDQKGLIRISTRHEDGMVEISVADTGCGIPEAVRDKIFDPFFTTKEVGRGTGQGLFIARSVVVEKHGGTLTFESEVGKGTTFFVRLPACCSKIVTKTGGWC